MPKIYHMFEVNTPAAKVYENLTTIKGLSGWWTKETSGNPEKGGEIRFGFGENFNIVMVNELMPNKHVVWEVIQSAFPSGNQWIWTKISFTLTEESQNKTTIRFEHTGWRSITDFFGVCNYNWALTLASLKSLCETGKGNNY
jgi:uncharacterized protein YndB with AHSA1/START domain